MINFAQTSESDEITKMASRQIRTPSFTRTRRSMRTSTKDKTEGSFHEVKGTITEKGGKLTNDRDLKAEEKAGTVQQQIGHAKEAVTALEGMAELISYFRTQSSEYSLAGCGDDPAKRKGDEYYD
jgi:uncharacterized protein YjbJ (UPF0337 family)